MTSDYIKYKKFTTTTSTVQTSGAYGWAIDITYANYQPVCFTLTYAFASQTTVWAEGFSSERLAGFSTRAEQTIEAWVLYFKK